MFKKIFIVFLTIFVSQLHAQTVDSVKFQIDRAMQNIRVEHPVNADINLTAEPENLQNILNHLQIYSHDTIPAIRRQAVKYIGSLGLKNNDTIFKRRFVEQLAGQCFDSSAVVVDQALKALVRFNKTDFSQKAILLCDSLAAHPKFYIPRIYKLTGYIGNFQSEQILKSQLSKAKTTKEKWDIQLALARLNNAEANQYILNKLKAATINNDFTNLIVPDLVYTHQPIVYQYLLGLILNSSDQCVTHNPDRPVKILCSFFIAEKLAGHIAGFPVETDKYGELIDDLDNRQLDQIKQWIASNPDFEIIDNGY